MNRIAASSLFSSGLAACFCLVACKRTPPPSAGRSASTTALAAPTASAAPSATGAANPGGGRIKEPSPTTSPEITMLNFRAQFPEYERHLKAQPESLMWTGSLLRARQAEVSSFGVVSSLDKVVELGDKAAKDHPKEAKAHLLRAASRSAVHDFAGAAKELDEAEKLHSAAKLDLDMKPGDIESARASLTMALGKYDDAHAMYLKLIEERPQSSSLLMLDGVCLSLMQKTADAVQRLDEAEQQYRDVSAMFVASLYFERGNLWDKAGDPTQAKVYYRIAVERLPQYAHATLHLSELVHATEAKPLLEKLLETADDPEAHASLSLVLEELAPGSGKEHFDKAKSAYDELMTKFPLAFADHAGWFYLNVAKEPERALDAAKLNLDNRKTAEAHELYVAALLGAKKDAEACKAADDALKFKYPSVDLRLRAAEAYDRCDKKELAQKQRGLVGNVKTGGRGR